MPVERVEPGRVRSERMRSMGSPRHLRWCGFVAVLVLLGEGREALAQRRPTCVNIRTDETVSSAARRLTGDPRNTQASWFQVLNPTTARRVPKDRYHLRFAGWRACIVDGSQPRAAFAPTAATEPEPLPPPVEAARSQPGARGDTRLPAPPHPTGWEPVAVIWCALVLFIAGVFWMVDEQFTRRKQVRRVMQCFADRFVREFERPLIQEHLANPPIQSRVRLKPGRSRLDVLLAPTAGRRYPNLTDHRQNLLYDVVRVQEALQDRSFVSRAPYARGRWVVVPFQHTVGM
jgi:hypothetical protein